MDSNKILLLDGGLSNDLNNRVNFDIHKEPLWTAKAILTDPNAVIETHLAYLQAGADIIETSSYQATIEGFKDFMNLEAVDAKKYIQESVRLAKLAVEKFKSSKDFDENTRQCPIIAGSIGPYGVYLCDGSEYTGSYINTVTKSHIEDMHLPRIQSLVDGGVDILAIETMPCLEEVKIILDLVQQHYPTTKVWVSFSIKEGKPDHTAAGDLMEDAYKVISEYSQVLAFGINCCMPTDVLTFLKTVKEFVGVKRQLKIIVYPNSGQQWIRGQGWIKETLPTLDTFTNSWIDMGVSIIGGCCQVGTDQIIGMRTVIDIYNNNNSNSS